MLPRILEYEDGRVKVTPEAYTIPEIKRILDKHDDMAEPYLAYVSALSYPDSPYKNIPKEERAEAALFDIKDTMGDFGAGQIGWGYFDEGKNFIGSAQKLTNPLVLGLSGTAGVKVKVEILDSKNKSKSFYVTLESGVKNYSFDLSGLEDVGLINFVVDQKTGGKLR